MNFDKLRNAVLESVAKNLREFGYPDATAENVATDWLYAKFVLSNLEEERDTLIRHGGPTMRAVIDSIEKQCKAVPEPKAKKRTTKKRSNTA